MLSVSSATKNVQSVMNLYKAFEKRDVLAIMQLVHLDIAVSQTEVLPWGGTYKGLDGLKKFFDKLLLFVDSEVTMDEYIDAGDRVVAIGRTKGTVLANKKPFDVRVAHVWTIKDGKANKFEPSIDTPTMLEALK